MMVRSHILAAALSLLLLSGVAAAQSDVDIQLVQYGVGNAFRPGDVIGVEVELTSNLPQDENVWLQWDHETVDGDIVALGRQVAISPGQPRRTWLYVPLAPTTSMETQSRLRVRSLEDGEPGGDLGVLRFEPSIVTPRLVDRQSGLIGIIGRQMVGLPGYERPLELMRGVYVTPERTMLPLLPSAASLPDRWLGLRPYECLVWTDTEVELSPPQETALIEWMNRGGHLVIMLPQAGNPWSLGTGEDGPLGSIMPGEPTVSTVPINDLLPGILKNAPVAPLEASMPVHLFRTSELNAAPAEEGWIDLWTIDDVGTTIVQRPVGRGQLTLIGVDLAAPPLRGAALGVTAEQARVEAVPEPDLFWNRILGRRADTPPSRAIKDLGTINRLTETAPTRRYINDALIQAETDDASQVGGGLLIAFLLFVGYWVIAVPVCWALLKARKKLQWSWVGFFAVSLVFTAIAWITVILNRESNVRIQHLTVLDHVHGEDQQRAVSWLSIFTPGYGDYELQLDSDTEGLVTTWEPEDSRISGFPDTRQTTVDVGRNTNELTIPSRATTTSLQLDWRGPITASDWGGVLRMDPSMPITIQRNSEGKPVILRGAIVSELPDTLKDGMITFVDRAQPVTRELDRVDGEAATWVRPSQSGRMEREGWAWAMTPLDPGERYILDNQLLDDTYDMEETFRKRFGDSVRSDIGTPMRPLSDRERRTALAALSFYHQLEPPAWIRPAGQTRDRDWSITNRTIGRELDISPWLNRPSIIVTGFLDPSRLPVPLLVEGVQPEESTGLVLVRWIFPLEEAASPSPPASSGAAPTEG
ncbi:MAG: hypothetical protein MK116_00825 [Phycisphaerales bacterium]|nr:hypothetical protein [Phycisphaerales bacterium]